MHGPHGQQHRQHLLQQQLSAVLGVRQHSEEERCAADSIDHINLQPAAQSVAQQVLQRKVVTDAGRNVQRGEGEGS